METSKIKEQLEVFYTKSNLRKNDGKDCPSYKNCSASCRLNNRYIMPPTGCYVGDDYDKYRVLFIGINTNRGSTSSDDFYSIEEWISGIGSEHSPYIDGACHWFSCLIMDDFSLVPGETKKLFAFTNAIKCSVDQNAGEPTACMTNNCIFYHRYLFDEIILLQPRIIVTLGGDPYNALQVYFSDSLSYYSEQFKGWTFEINIHNTKTRMICGYNPGQGYRSVRNWWKKIKSGTIPETLKCFFTDSVFKNKSPEDIYEYLESMDKEKKVKTHSPNPLYTFMMSKLIETVKQSKQY